MSETIFKLQPDRDLLCYFLRPSAVAALSSTSPNGFTVSGSWRQQFDWAVIEWNRDNAFEHPALRFLPDGDLSGLTLSYLDTRSACIPLDSNIYPTVDWPYLRIWLDSPSGEIMRRVRLSNYATPETGAYVPAAATFQLTGSLTTGDTIELSWDAAGVEHYYYTIATGDTPAIALSQLANAINSPLNAPLSAVHASTQNSSITLTLLSTPVGANGNRVGAYASISGAGTEGWQPLGQQFSGGVSPSTWLVTLPFGSLADADQKNADGTPVIFAAVGVRKMRWTYAADLQSESFKRTEFVSTISSWTVAGANRAYSVAGAKARRIEDDSADVAYSGTWTLAPAAKGDMRGARITGTNPPGNFSGGSVALATVPASSLTIKYAEPASHQLYLGTRITNAGAQLSVKIDNGMAFIVNVHVDPAVDYVDTLARVPLGSISAGQHTVVVTHSGSSGTSFYFDFLEIAYPTSVLPNFTPNSVITLATDWDTDHSVALAPERTAWLLSKLGFHGRANHYIGALLWFEMSRVGQIYASGTITFAGTSSLSVQTTLTVNGFPFFHLHLQGDTPETVAKVFELTINNGSTSVWAKAAGNKLTITSRTMGIVGDQVALSVAVVQSGGSQFSAGVSGPTLSGGIDGSQTGVEYQDANVGWRTDLSAAMTVNRAARDWHRSYFAALKSYGIEATCAFSTELQFVDPSLDAGMAQRYPDGTPVVLNTPAIQTNFSPTSLAYWQECYVELAQVMQDSGSVPYMQFGEVQWWYFPPSGGIGLPFYDAYTTAQFTAQFGRPMAVFLSSSQSMADFPQEAAFLPAMIGSFTSAIIASVRKKIPSCKFEVLYPPDVNNSPLMRVANLPLTWNSASLDALKTENFTYTGDRNLDLAGQSVALPGVLGFPQAKSSHLIGIGDYTTPWIKEVGLSKGAGLESIVLFALDQFCLIGYPVDFYSSDRRGLLMA